MIHPSSDLAESPILAFPTDFLKFKTTCTLWLCISKAFLPTATVECGGKMGFFLFEQVLVCSAVTKKLQICSFVPSWFSVVFISHFSKT